jgi:hypothetical protein
MACLMITEEEKEDHQHQEIEESAFADPPI